MNLFFAKQRLKGVGYSIICPQLKSEQQEVIKWVGIIAMIIAHAGLLVDSSIAYTIGRIAFPSFAFLIVYNFLYNSTSPFSYLARLLLIAIISQAPYMLLTGCKPWDLNVMFTLASGLAMVWALDWAFVDNEDMLKKLAVGYGVITFWAVTGWTVDGFYMAPLVMVAFWGWMRFVGGKAIYFALIAVLLMNLPTGYINALVGLLFFALLEVVIFFDLKLPRIGKWFFYAFYPVHLILLHIAKVIL